MPILLPDVHWPKGKPFPKVGYNSHGHWTNLKEIRELEVDERENEFPDLAMYPDDTSAIWITTAKRKALRYRLSADEWDRIDGSGRLTKHDLEELEMVAPIRILDDDVITAADGDGGYLLLRPSGIGWPDEVP